MNIHLFGATSLVGKSYSDLIRKSEAYKKIFPYSSSKNNLIYFDLKDFKNYKLLEIESNSIIISFAPIWLFKEYLVDTFENNLEILKNVKGFIVCSSSSSLTKKFATNKFDKYLSKKLHNSEEQILDITKAMNKYCLIIQPSLIYGSYLKRKDKNISKIIKLCKIMPFIVLPKQTGLRQPIHINQLAKVFFHFTEEILHNSVQFEKYNNTKALIGGDSEISYLVMIKELIKKLNIRDTKINCKIITIPNRLFLFLFAPLIIFSPRYFAVIERLSSDLSGFNKVSKITNDIKQKFPIDPFY